ncbi:pheA operon leader peptide PheL [Pluralibacter gergoviae]|nr:pheA operon leader peptide PheL [uncultured Pluralibacter sp.]
MKNSLFFFAFFFTFP